MNGAARAEHQGGFTLLELIAAIAITGIVVVGMGAAITHGFAHIGRSQEEVHRARTATFAARYFGEDVANTPRSPQPEVNPPRCGVDGQSKIKIPRANGTDVHYVIVGLELVRRVCVRATNIQQDQRLLGPANDASATWDGSTATLTIEADGAPDVILRGVRRVTTQ